MHNHGHSAFELPDFELSADRVSCLMIICYFSEPGNCPNPCPHYTQSRSFGFRIFQILYFQPIGCFFCRCAGDAVVDTLLHGVTGLCSVESIAVCRRFWYTCFCFGSLFLILGFPKTIVTAVVDKIRFSCVCFNSAWIQTHVSVQWHSRHFARV